MTSTPARGTRDFNIFVVAGEHSGDALGAKLMSAINASQSDFRRVRFDGVGGPQMEAQGLQSLFPMHEVAVMGIGAIVKNLPRLMKRVYQTVDAALIAKPDVVVIIDSPEFTHPIAKRIRRRDPSIPIIDYVSPSVWAWRPGRAKRMRAYVDHVLALLPFEPEAHRKLKGPACSYVGHPLSERIPWIEALDPAPLAERLGLDPARPVLVVLPGSRSSEVKRLMQPFGEGLTQLAQTVGPFEMIMPVVDHVRGLVEEGLKTWTQRPHFVSGEEDKFRAFKLAHAALAASGTVTLELALAGAPMIVAYKVDPIMMPILRRLITAETAVLVNHILGERAIPELLQEYCTPTNIASALVPLMLDTTSRTRQLEAVRRVPQALALPSGTPSEAAARIVLQYAAAGRG
jgi:lipid-A-disaccharide synthase